MISETTRFGLLAGAAIIDRDVRALCCQAERDLAPDAARRTCHQSNFSLQSKSMIAPSCFVVRPRRLDQAEQALRRYRKFVDLDAKRRQRVATALATAAGEPMVPPSPMPRKPPSVVGDSASRCTTCIGGISHAVGTR